MNIKVKLIMACLCLATYADAQVISRVASLYGSRSLRVTRIEYGDEATKITFKTTKECSPTLKIGHGIYLIDDKGERHHAVSAEGIKFDSLYVMVKGQKRKFTISFAPVAKGNEAVDVTDPDRFRICGLHDARKKLEIPDADQTMNPYETAPERFETGYVDIEGMFHNESDWEGTVYANYYSVRPYLNEADRLDKFDGIGPDGHFHVRFKMYCPQEVGLIESEFGGRWYGNVFLRPGDSVWVDVYDKSDGKGVECRNLKGRETYNALMNRVGIDPGWDWIYGHVYGTGWNARNYPAYTEKIKNFYKEAPGYANYVCRHYGMSPSESHLYFERIRASYILALLNMELKMEGKLANMEYIQEDTCEGMHKILFASMVNRMIENTDRSYLKDIDPEDASFLFLQQGKSMAGMLMQLRPFNKCHDMVPEDDPDRWMKVIDIQRKELERIAGWAGMPVFFQYMIVNDYPALFGWKPADERQYKQVRELISHPYCRKYLDIMHRELLDKERQKNAN